MARLSGCTQRGCDLFQGYWFSKPVPAAALEALFTRDFVRPSAVEALAAAG